MLDAYKVIPQWKLIMMKNMKAGVPYRRACALANVAPSKVHQERRKDQEFDAALTEAEKAYNTLEAYASRMRGL